MEKLAELKDVLLSKIIESDRIIIVPHKNADLDAIGSALALSAIAKYLKKPSFILIDENFEDLDESIKMIIDETKKEYTYIKSEDISNSEQDLYILTDVNGISRTNLPKDLKDQKHETIIIDHHFPSADIINTPNTFINVDISSASEILVKILSQLKIKIDKNSANYLLAGIYLDTNKLTKNTTSTTMTDVVRLLKQGASIEEINKYFAENFKSDRKVQQIINSSEFYLLNIVIATGDDDIKYTCEEIAKAADYLLKFDTSASFAIGNIGNNTVSISGRSNGKVDINKIMTNLGGGGNVQSGAAHIENTKPSEVKHKLIKVLKPNYLK